VAPEEAEDLCRGLGLKFYRVCVKENFNVDNVFDYLVRQWSDCDRELVAAQAPAMDIREIARKTEIDRGEAVVSGGCDCFAGRKEGTRGAGALRRARDATQGKEEEG
jgi:hypothetical protein